MTFFQKGLAHGFGPKMAIFPIFFFLGNFSQEKVFYDILEGVNAFLGFEKKKFKNWKINIFSKELTHAFGPKMAIFPTLFFRQYREGKCILRYSRTKNASLGYKKSAKSQRIHIFPKGLTHAFGPKIAIFPGLFFRQYTLGKCLLQYCRTKKRLSRG